MGLLGILGRMGLLGRMGIMGILGIVFVPEEVLALGLLLLGCLG